MSTYTMELRKIPEIFNFEYELYDNNLKNNFQEKFIQNFYFREIGFETIERFQFYLKSELNKIMPYYKELYKTTLYEYDALINYDMLEETKRNQNENNKSSSKGDKNITSSETSSSVTEKTNVDDRTLNNQKFDTPITKNNNYKTSPSFIEDNTDKLQSSYNDDTSNILDNETKETNNLTINNDNNVDENITLTRRGNIGVMSTQDLIQKERDLIINIDLMIFEELDMLFMQIW